MTLGTIALPIRTERLTLRAYRPEDADDLSRIAGREEIARSVPPMPHPYSREAAVEFVETATRALEEGRYHLVITCRETGVFIGGCAIVPSAEHRRAEIGYWIDPDRWGRGIATEVARALVDAALRDLDLVKLTAHHFGGNPASGRVLEKSGFTREGMYRESYWHRDEFHDVFIYGLLRKEDA